MRRSLRFAIVSMLIALSVGSCHNSGAPEPTTDPTPETVTLLFEIELNQQVYEDSTWGDPPQMAVWLQDETDDGIRTVAVTHRTGAGDWEGKVECSIALPYWATFHNRETGTQGPPTWDHPAADAITCATPRAKLNPTARVPRGTRWAYFVEVNVSGDCSIHFPHMSEDGFSDRYGNGQPSIIYRGSIEAMEGSASQPELWGRTDQHIPVETAITDVHQITTARELLRAITVSCIRERESLP
jgi:hypothetical protein